MRALDRSAARQPAAGRSRTIPFRAPSCRLKSVTITLNGEPHDLAAPMTVSALLAELQIDPRRVAVEVNLTIVRRAAFAITTVGDGDRVEIVNFVGGG